MEHCRRSIRCGLRRMCVIACVFVVLRVLDSDCNVARLFRNTSSKALRLSTTSASDHFVWSFPAVVDCDNLLCIVSSSHIVHVVPLLYSRLLSYLRVAFSTVFANDGDCYSLSSDPLPSVLPTQQQLNEKRFINLVSNASRAHYT